MFSGKTEELIRRVRRALIDGLKVENFKPTTDTRYDEFSVVSHDKNSIPATPVNNAEAVFSHLAETQIIAIDEAQFFDNSLPEVCEKLSGKGIRVIIAGLDKDYRGKPFGPMPELLAIADTVTKLQAVCVVCREPATFSFRTSAIDSKIFIGEKESYEPRCRRCYIQGRELSQ